MQKCAFFDRDGVINIDKGYVYQKKDFLFCEGIFTLLELLKERGFLLIVVTNQSGINRGYYTQEQVEVLHKFMQEQIKLELGFCFDRIYFCPHVPEENCRCRKPQSGMIESALHDFCIDLSRSLLIGDKPTDIQCAQEGNVAQKFFITKQDCSLQLPNITNLHQVQNLGQIGAIIRNLQL
ncbi:MAG: HAD family hydrolase [Helicobacter sp.]|nr:HAD family hydrolase [Helicobacter sp.]MDY5741115.1 HAD family hydrolase [Helicobacter sp.]